MAKARKAQSDVDSSTIDIGIDSERRSRQFVKVTRCSARVASLVPCSKPPTPRRKRSPSDRVALEHYAELALVWPADPRIPTAASRRAWCLARGLKPEVVNVWWYRRKTVAKRLGLRIPEDKYELDVGVPPVVAIKQYDELDDLDIKPRVKTENLDEDVALLLGLDLGNAQKAAQEKRSGYTESSRSVSPSATLLAPSSDGHALLNVPSSEFGAILEDQMLQNSSPPPEEGAYNWVTNDAQRPTGMVAKEHLEAFAPVDLSQTQPLARSLRLPNDILYYQRKAYEADSDDRQTQGGHLTRVNSPATTGIVLRVSWFFISLEQSHPFS